MVASSPDSFARSSILQLCLARRVTSAELQQGIAGLRALAHQEHALELRLAMELAWLKQQDPVQLGYSSFGALCRENVDWSRSWIHSLVRLVESPLVLVKRAACEGVIPLRVAVLAPASVGVADQGAWLTNAALDALEPRDLRCLDAFEGEDAVAVRKARRLGRLLLGRPATTREVDDFILEAWRARTPAEVLLERARTPPQPPGQREPMAWDWYHDPDTDSLLEPWSEPASPEESLRRVDRIQAVLRGRRPLVAKAWAIIHHEGMWACAGFQSAAQFANDVLGVSLRTAQRLARAGWALAWYPELEAAVRSGLAFGAAYELEPLLDTKTVARWVALAERVGRRELGLAVEEAKQTRPAEVCARYLDAIGAADAWWHARCAQEGEHTTTAGHLRVALPHPEGHAPATLLRAPPELPEAARWLVETVPVESGRGFAAVKTRDRHRCQNPECGRLSLCNQAHHIRFRSHGGSDDPDNGVTVCRSCHLRALHTARITVERVSVGGGEALLWSYPGRHVLQLREVPRPH